jgi:hypothetical protein
VTVYANGRSILHKGDGRIQTSGTPDVCKTPSPGGPVPIPYPNIAKDSDLADGTGSVTIEGNPVALQSSNLSTSTGDEAGTAGGGIISSKTKGKCTWVAASATVMFEGKGVVRFMDTCLHNGNTSNAGGQPNQGLPGAPSSVTQPPCDPHAWERLNDDDTPEDRIKALEQDTGNAGSAYNACLARKFQKEGKNVDVSARYKCPVCGEYQEVDLLVDDQPIECKSGNKSAKKKQTMNYVQISDQHFAGAPVTVMFQSAARAARDTPHVENWGAQAKHMEC